MKSFAIGLTLLELASISYAAPGSTRVRARQAAEDVITFQGAGPNPPSYTETIPNDCSLFEISTSQLSQSIKYLHTSAYSLANIHFQSPCTIRGEFVMTDLRTDNALSISHIISASTNPGTCTFFGVDGSVTTVSPGAEVNVGPPQTQLSGRCCSSSSTLKPRQTVVADVTFSGAGPNPPTYTEVFVANGTPQPIGKPFSFLPAT